MIVTFEETYLKELFVEGKSSDKRHRYQPDIVRRYQKGVRALMSASSKESLYNLKSLNFEALIGNNSGKFSIRVNIKYKIVFTLRNSIEEPIVTICNIEELSNHYD